MVLTVYIEELFIVPLGPSWSWSYGSWILNYICNQCLFNW